MPCTVPSIFWIWSEALCDVCHDTHDQWWRFVHCLNYCWGTSDFSQFNPHVCQQYHCTVCWSAFLLRRRMLSIHLRLYFAASGFELELEIAGAVAYHGPKLSWAAEPLKPLHQQWPPLNLLFCCFISSVSEFTFLLFCSSLPHLFYEQQVQFWERVQMRLKESRACYS